MADNIQEAIKVKEGGGIRRMAAQRVRGRYTNAGGQRTYHAAMPGALSRGGSNSRRQEEFKSSLQSERQSER